MLLLLRSLSAPSVHDVRDLEFDLEWLQSQRYAAGDAVWVLSLDDITWQFVTVVSADIATVTVTCDSADIENDTHGKRGKTEVSAAACVLPA